MEKLRYYEGRTLRPAVARFYLRRLSAVRRLLDVGCGTGELGRYAAAEGIEVHGVDVDEGAVAKAAAFEQAICLDLDRDDLPYEDGFFDAVLARDVFEHLRDPARAAREVRRVLRPGCVAVVSVVMARPKRVWADYTHVRGFTKDAARLLLEDAGLAVEDVWPMGPVPLSSRLGFVALLPFLLRVPGPAQLWGVSWELQARSPSHG